MRNSLGIGICEYWFVWVMVCVGIGLCGYSSGRLVDSFLISKVSKNGIVPSASTSCVNLVLFYAV